ncbi:hypothetical protein PRIPAC_85207 [Pristionchus pacificus]|uniref:Uncharacterized protein n=1 Tax=Pristionchus pacificus TaxID=54126 RepID=A0A2A6BRS1_PRIPA|nr:hypothetical protein PRIPAC_85207 [Pristionchus pacificus]|eukprot:PDM68595.1 hypothetical protein PRIPAC_46897 [Pristionchus pacificus]
MTQLLTYLILSAVVLLCLQAVASNSVHLHRGTRSALCNYNGREVARGVCEFTPGVSGERCNQCNEDCKDKRGWCMPLDEY